MNKTRRNLLKGILLVAASSLIPNASKAVEALEKASSLGDCESYYYEPWVLKAQDKIAYYQALGLTEKIGNKIVVKNPLLPDKCMTYTKHYKYDHYELPPPGADEDYASKCIRCSLCYAACTNMGYGVLRLKGFEENPAEAGVPVAYDLYNHPCELCMECVKVCPTDALAKVKPKDVKMGIAMIDPDLCWAWNSGDCESCASACPRGAEVFEFTYNEWGKHTRVKPEQCNGCGLCMRACPVPGAAIHVLPKEEYERRAKNFKNTGMTYEEYIKLIFDAEVNDPYKATIRSSLNADYLINVRKAKRPTPGL